MFLISSILIGLIAIKILSEKQSSNAEQAELVPVRVENSASMNDK